ncbi:hypothetical protein L218DRAFT_996630 [Marasmius fiardii PR-910]|nr:hypothetical protein L218DRAFT_996630 [Marasmius fiardii PR-910]
MKIENGRLQMTTAAMVNSGATGLFMSRRFAEEKKLRKLQLKKPVQVFNIDGTPCGEALVANTQRLEQRLDSQQLVPMTKMINTAQYPTKYKYAPSPNDKEVKMGD